jgi:hypothetical protein
MSVISVPTNTDPAVSTGRSRGWTTTGVLDETIRHLVRNVLPGLLAGEIQRLPNDVVRYHDLREVAVIDPSGDLPSTVAMVVVSVRTGEGTVGVEQGGRLHAAPNSLSSSTAFGSPAATGSKPSNTPAR